MNISFKPIQRCNAAATSFPSIIISGKMGEVQRKRKVIKTLLKIHHWISQSREGSCALFSLRKYLCKHLEVSIFLCSLGAEEGRDPPGRDPPLEEKKTGE